MVRVVTIHLHKKLPKNCLSCDENFEDTLSASFSMHITIGFSHHAAQLIPMTYSFHNWKPVPPDTLLPFCPPTKHLPPWQPPLFSVSASLFVPLIYFLDFA